MTPPQATRLAWITASPLRLTLLAFALACCTAWLRPLLLPDEGRYAGVAWEMLRSGDWLTPTLNGLPYFHKPPLFYWLTASSLAVFGLHEWAARLAPATGFALAIASMTWLLSRWLPGPGWRWLLLALTSQPLLLVGGQYANLDMLVAGFITLTICAFAHGALSLDAGRPARAALQIGWVAAACGVLAKGLIGIVIPAGVVGLWLLSALRWRLILRVLLACPEGPVRRPAQESDKAAAELWRLGWVWVVVVVAFFSIPKSKLVGYILPAVPPLALLATLCLMTRSKSRDTPGRGWLVASGIGIAASLATVLTATFIHLPSSRGIAQTLKTRVQGDSPVVMLGRFDFDTPLYAQLQRPMWVVDQWNDEARMRARDNWRKELADAAAFDRRHAEQVLITPDALPARLCAAPASWLVSARDPGPWTILQAAEPVTHWRNSTLWRFDPRGAAASWCASLPK